MKRIKRGPPAAFRTLFPADTGPALALHEPELRHSYDVCEIFMPPRVATFWRPCDEPDMELFEKQGCAGGCEHGPKTSPKVACGESSGGGAQNGCRGHQVFMLQRQPSGSFMLEHPVSSRLWKIPSVMELVREEVVHQIDFHMCAHGMRSPDPQGDGFVFRPARVLTNTSALAEHLGRRYVGGHRHVHAEIGSSQPASHYTQEPCDCTLDGHEMDIVMKKESHLVAETEQVGHADMCDACDNANFIVNYVDYRTGLTLDPKMVQQARAEEMKVFAEMGVNKSSRLIRTPS